MLHSQFGVLASFPVNAVFVLDGSDRSGVKRDSRVGSPSHWLATQAEELAKAFGFEVQKAQYPPFFNEAATAHTF